MRAGLIAEKIGMTQVFTESGTQVPLTVLRVDSCQVVAVKNHDKDGYVALQLGVGKVKPSSVSKPMRGHYAKASVEPKRILAEFVVDANSLLDVGAELKVDHFSSGQYVDITGSTIGKGFAGAMKRHGFGGLRASHGVSISHRSHGSTGNRQDPGKVFKNKKMAGHMGSRRVTTLNLRIHDIDLDQGLIYVIGAVPGSVGGYVCVRDAVKRPLSKQQVAAA